MKKWIRQTGFTLIEIVVVSFIISFLLISIISLQEKNLKMARKNYYLSVAYIQAYSLFDLLRANPSSSKRHQAFLLWNKLNSDLLPQGKGKFDCFHQNCQVNLSWIYHSKQHIELQAIIL